MQVSLRNCHNQEVGVYDLPDEIFAVDPRSDILSRVVTWQLAKRQQGTHAVKGRSDVQGSTRKIYRQKGTGRARHGSCRGAQFRGGGIIFGPVVRSHAFSLNKKVRALGLKMALASKALSGNIVVFENFQISQPRTKIALSTLSFLDRSSALLIDVYDETQFMKKAISALKNIDILPTVGANVYDILKKDKLVLTVDAIQALKERLA